MTDRALRALERAQRAAPSVETEAALLRARLRAGTLAPERLELAAYCGHEAARWALGKCSCGCGWPHGIATVAGPFATDLDRHRDHTDSRDLPVWVAGLSRWEPAVLTRAAVAAARVALPEWLAELGWWLNGRDTIAGFDGLVHTSLRRQSDEDCRAAEAPVLAIEAAEAWLAEPSEANRIAAARALLAARPVDGGLNRAWLPMVPTSFAAGTHPTREGGGWGEEPPYPGPSLWNTQAIEHAVALTSAASVREAIQRALIAWALGG